MAKTLYLEHIFRPTIVAMLEDLVLKFLFALMSKAEWSPDTIGEVHWFAQVDQGNVIL